MRLLSQPAMVVRLGTNQNDVARGVHAQGHAHRDAVEQLYHDRAVLCIDHRYILIHQVPALHPPGETGAGAGDKGGPVRPGVVDPGSVGLLADDQAHRDGQIVLIEARG